MRRSRWLRLAATAVVAGAAALLLVRAFSTIDVAGTLRAIAHAGACAPLALLPFVAGMTLDAIGMGALLRALGRSVPLAKLLPIRIATEALHLTAPAGFLVSDSASATLLESQCDVDVREGAVVMVARKWLVMRAHAVYIVLGAASGAGVLTAMSLRSLGGSWLPWAIGASSLIPLSLSIALGAGFRGRPALARLQTFLTSLRWCPLRDRIARWNTGAAAVDAHLARIGASRGLTWKATAAFFVCWLFESLETALILWLVGAPFDFAMAMAAEVGISLVRSVGNVAPAGLGVQEASYAATLTAMSFGAGSGVGADTAAAFVLLKRGKELVWIGVGYALLTAMRRSEAARPAASPSAVELVKV